MTGQVAENVKSLATQLDRLRRQAGLSFRDLSRLTGHPVSTLHNALTGRVVARLDTVLSIARACGQAEAPWRERWADVTQGGGSEAAVPRELPRAARVFAGRKEQAARLLSLIEREHEQGMGIIAVHGMPGVGKTAFAVRVAHQLSDRFPDGQLFVDLRAHRPGAEPMTAAEALPTLLRSLGVAGQSIPAALDGQIRLYRTVLSGRKVLVLLDDALDAAQVRALVPSGAGCMLIVTSRYRLDGIVALDGAHAFHLDVLTEVESNEMLAHLLPERSTTEDIGELAKLCGHLPLALRVAAANLAMEPQVRLTEALAELAGDRMTGLQMPADGRVAVQATFAQSYQRLSAGSATLLRRLGSAPCGQFTVDSASVLWDAPARQALEELAARCLIEKHVGRRYSMHELIRLFAADRAREEDPEPVREAAFDRLLDWYRRRVDAAARLLYPERIRLPGSIVVDEPTFDDQRQALDWLDAELENLVGVVTHAGRHSPQPAVWSLADSLRGYFLLRLRLQEWTSVAEAGLHAAEVHADRQALGAMRHSLGVAHSHGGDHRAAERNLTQALALYRSVQWIEGCAAILICLGGIYFHLGRLDEAAGRLEEALSLAARHDIPVMETAALGDLGEVYRDLGLLHRARDHQTRTAGRCRELGMSRGHAIALVCLGLVCIDLGELTPARVHLSEARQRLQALGSRDGEAYATIGLAAVNLAAGAVAEALAAADQARDMAESISDDSLIVEASLVRAEALHQLEQPEAAAAEARRACGVASEQDYHRGHARGLVVLAAAQLALGGLDEARTSCLRALELSNARGYRVTAGNALTMLATLDHHAGQDATAAEHARLALSTHRQTGHRLGETKTLTLLGRLAQVG